MSKEEKYGFVYIWRDRQYNMYYIGCHWGNKNDKYICSSRWMNAAYKRRPEDFKRRILKTNIPSRIALYEEEQKWLNLIKPLEIQPYTKEPRYYNLSLSSKNAWHKYDEKIKVIGGKISEALKGKPTAPCSPEKAKKISEAKKASFAKKPMSPEWLEKIRQNNVGRKHTEEWKNENRERLKKQWADGTRKRKEPKQKMTREEQDILCSSQLKDRWANPEWKAKQREALKKAWEIRKANGKATNPCPPERAKKISETKKEKFAANPMPEEQKERLRRAAIGYKHTDEFKAEQSLRMKEQWDKGIIKKKELPFPTP